MPLMPKYTRADLMYTSHEGMNEADDKLDYYPNFESGIEETVLRQMQWNYKKAQMRHNFAKESQKEEAPPRDFVSTPTVE